MIDIRVVLPEPFGRSRPSTPESAFRRRSSSAVTRPSYTLVSWTTSTPTLFPPEAPPPLLRRCAAVHQPAGQVEPPDAVPLVVRHVDTALTGYHRGARAGERALVA